MSTTIVSKGSITVGKVTVRLAEYRPLGRSLFTVKVAGHKIPQRPVQAWTAHYYIARTEALEATQGEEYVFATFITPLVAQVEAPVAKPSQDGCTGPCVTCEDARRTRATGRYTWVQCEQGSTVRSA